MAEPFAPYAGIEGAALTGGEGGDALHNLLMGILQGTATLPQRVIDAAKATAPGLRRDDFTDGPGAAQPGEELRRGALETGLTMMGGAPAVSGVSKAGEVALGIVPVDAGRAFGIPSRLPDSDLFRQAVKNTPGAAIDAEALTMPVMRRQKPEQEMSESVRGGVFYLPEGSPQAKFYNTGTKSGSQNSYGGSDLIQGDTAIKAPLFVKGATGGKAPETAYDTLLGKGAYQDMRTDALKAYGPYGAKMDQKVEATSAFLEKYAPELAPMAYDIVRNSGQGNQLAYALQEAAVASAARKHGHDAILGYSVGRGPDKAPKISEVFDVRESHYPSPSGDYQTWSPDMFGGPVGALKGR
jgi:hypothetical protein